MAFQGAEKRHVLGGRKPLIGNADKRGIGAVVILFRGESVAEIATTVARGEEFFPHPRFFFGNDHTLAASRRGNGRRETCRSAADHRDIINFFLAQDAGIGDWIKGFTKKAADTAAALMVKAQSSIKAARWNHISSSRLRPDASAE